MLPKYHSKECGVYWVGQSYTLNARQCQAEMFIYSTSIYKKLNMFPAEIKE